MTRGAKPSLIADAGMLVAVADSTKGIVRTVGLGAVGLGVLFSVVGLLASRG
jgi:hypothetical protein